MTGSRGKRILLVDPPSGITQGLNMGLGWLASNVRGVEEVRVLPLGNRSMDLRQGQAALARCIEAFEPDLVGFNIHCTTYGTALQMIETCRAHFRGPVIVGGPHAVYEGARVLERSPHTDAVVMGEAEHTFTEVCGRPPGEYAGIPGTAYRRGDDIIVNPPERRSGSLDDLRHPDYRQFGVKRIFSPYPLSTSRGCPYRCSFCNPHMGGQKWRPRPLDSVFEELDFARKAFGIRQFQIVEPVFNLLPERVIRFCDELIRRQSGLPWFCASGLRADRLTPEMLKSMKRAGCTHIKIGVESLVPEVFDHINKGESLEDIERAVDMVKQEGLPLWGSFIVGLPHDTYATVMETLRRALRLGFDFTEWSLLMPYPGTASHAWMEGHGTLHFSLEAMQASVLDAVDGESLRVPCSTPEFPREERARAFREILWKSGNYLYPREDGDVQKAWAVLRGVLRHDPTHLYSHARFIWSRLKRRRAGYVFSGKMFEFHPDFC